MEKTVFIGAVYPNNILNEYIKKYEINQVSAYVFGWKIVNGLAEDGIKVCIVNEHKSFSFPKGPLFTPKTKQKMDMIELYGYGNLNIPYLDRLSKIIIISKLLRKLKPSKIIVYSLHTPYLYPAIQYAMKNNCKTIVVIPDLPQYMFSSKSKIRSFLKEIDYKVIISLLEKSDGYVVLSEHMIDALGISKPYTVLEGIADDMDDHLSTEKKISSQKYILYAGGLDKEYGIETLIEEFLKIEGHDCELWLCGEGDYVEEIRKAASGNKKIKYLGFVDRETLNDIMSGAVLLVNPRSAKDEYTKYSFPSKTMEYLASGIPVMMEKLEGIPDEYYKYILTVKDGDWKNAIEKYLEKTAEEREAIGDRGRRFVIQNKNARCQCKKICKLLKVIENENP